MFRDANVLGYVALAPPFGGSTQAITSKLGGGRINLLQVCMHALRYSASLSCSTLPHYSLELKITPTYHSYLHCGAAALPTPPALHRCWETCCSRC